MKFQDIHNETDQYLLDRLNDEMKRVVMPVTIFVGVEAVLGLMGNILVIYVFAFHYKVCNFRYFVLCLAFIDLTSSLTTMPGEVITHLHWYDYPYPLICKIKSSFNMSTVCAEALCLLTISVDRYLKVCWPLGFQIKPRIAKRLCLAVYVISAITIIPVPLFWGTHSRQRLYMGRNITVSICEKDQRYLNTNKPLTYSICMEIFISITLVIMFFLYFFVGRNLILSRQKKKPKTEQSSISNSTDPKYISVISKDLSKTDAEIVSTSNQSLKGSTIQSINIVSPETSTDPNSHSNIADGKIYRKEGQVKTKKSHLKRKANTSHSNRKRSEIFGTKMRRKTLIMFILTLAFIITTVMFLTLLSLIASGILKTLSDAEKAAYFFFFRLYFINHVINPVIYGLLDPQFRRVMVKLKVSFAMKYSSSSQASTETKL